ncbi:MAG: hypothetical protein ACE5HP_04440 [Gemmatimonadota bacterium]
MRKPSRCSLLPGRATRGGECRGRRSAGGRGHAAVRGTGLGTLAALLLSATAVRAQVVEDYDYDNLRLRGVGVEVFYVSPNDLDETVGVGARFDLGFLGPHLRVMPRIAFWDSELEEKEVTRLETKLEELVFEQNPLQPRPDIQLGSVDQDALIFGADLHWMPVVEEPVRPYLGVGSEIYILNGSGDSIEGTFIEDRLDLLTAGVSGVVGLEIEVRNGLTLFGDVRGTLVADVRNVALTAGLAYIRP